MSEETKNVTLYQQKDQEGNLVAPLVPERGIYDEDGTRLDDKLKIVNLKRVGDAVAAGVETIKKEGDIQVAEVQKQLPTLKHQIGLDKYVKFNNSTNYKVGDVVLREDHLYKYKVDHKPGAWNYQEVYEVSMDQDLYEKLDEKKFDKNYVVQGLGSSKEKVPSQNSMMIKFNEISLYNVDFEIGDIKSSNGDPVIGNTTLRTKDFIKCSSYREIYVSAPIEKVGFIYFYDAAKSFLGLKAITSGGFNSISLEASYFKVVLSSSYGTTYKNDVQLTQKNPLTNLFNLVKRLIDQERLDINTLDPYRRENLTLLTDFEIGDIKSSNGDPVIGNTTLRTKDFIKCSSYREIYVSAPIEKVGFIYFYDAAKSFLGLKAITSGGFNSISLEASYFKVVLSSSYGTTYKNDVQCYIQDGYISLLNRRDLLTILTDFEIGDIKSSNGDPVIGNTTLRTKDFIKCSSYREIYVSAPIEKVGFIYFYDAAKSFLGLKAITSGGFNSISLEASYFKVVLSSSYGTTYKNDVFFLADYTKKKLIVSKHGDTQYRSVTEAVNEATDGDIIYINRGIYDNETIRAKNKNISIIGSGKNETIIMGSGDYKSPPIEMASGYLKGITFYAYGDTPTASDRYPYAIHSDWDILANNSFDIEDCIFKTDFGFGAVGMGLRGGCKVSFRNCDFIGKKASFFLNETVTKKGYNQNPGDQFIEFISCKFICNGEGTNIKDFGKCMAEFEGYKSRDSRVFLTFINNVFIHNNLIPNLAFVIAPEIYHDGGNNEGNIVIDSSGNTMTNWYLTNACFNNSVDSLNTCKLGKINSL